jgi:ABC-type glycerol-3-phosphate transport system substrate-binding protein
VRGPVVILPAGAMDKEAAVRLLAWMMSPEIVAEAAHANAFLPTSRLAAQDPRFRTDPDFQVFLDLMAHPNARPAATTPICSELNEALDKVESGLLNTGGDPVPLLNEVQAELAARLEEALADYDRP